MHPARQHGRIHPGRARSGRIRQRADHQHLGRQASGGWTSEAVRVGVSGSWQRRPHHAGVQGAVCDDLPRGQGEISQAHSDWHERPGTRRAGLRGGVEGCKRVEGGHGGRALLLGARMVHLQLRPLRLLQSQRAEGVSGRIRLARQHLVQRPLRGGLHGRDGAQRRCRPPGFLRAPSRQHPAYQLGAQPDLLRQRCGDALGELLRSAVVWPASRRHFSAQHRFLCGAGRAAQSRATSERVFGNVEHAGSVRAGSFAKRSRLEAKHFSQQHRTGLERQIGRVDGKGRLLRSNRQRATGASKSHFGSGRGSGRQAHLYLFAARSQNGGPGRLLDRVRSHRRRELPVVEHRRLGQHAARTRTFQQRLFPHAGTPRAGHHRNGPMV